MILHWQTTLIIRTAKSAILIVEKNCFETLSTVTSLTRDMESNFGRSLLLPIQATQIKTQSTHTRETHHVGKLSEIEEKELDTCGEYISQEGGQYIAPLAKGQEDWV